MAVLIDNRQNSQPIRIESLRRKAQAVLDALDSPEAELSVVLVDDAFIAELNRQYLQREGPTNVIAFPMQEGRFSEVSPQLLGDVVVSVDTARREAADAGIDFETRLDELLVHGILHLFGYDHETDAAQARIMESRSREILKMLKSL
jgi:probable rRNA maturation factor